MKKIKYFINYFINYTLSEIVRWTDIRKTELCEHKKMLKEYSMFLSDLIIDQSI